MFFFVKLIRIFCPIVMDKMTRLVDVEIHHNESGKTFSSVTADHTQLMKRTFFEWGLTQRYQNFLILE